MILSWYCEIYIVENYYSFDCISSIAFHVTTFTFPDKMKIEQQENGESDVKDFIRNGESQKVCSSFNLIFFEI